MTERANPPGNSRIWLEQFSARPLVYLRMMPRWLLPGAVAALGVTGLAAPAWAGCIALGVLAALLAWLAALSWPGVNAQGRMLRLMAVLIVAGLAILRALG